MSTEPLMTDPTPTDPFLNLQVGLNPVVLASLWEEWKKTATAEQILSATDMGIQHWAILSAQNHGVIPLSMERKTGKEDRTYTVGTFPVQGIPKPLRPAVTPYLPGHMLVELDLRASHLQIAAFRSGDEKLKEALRTGDIYANTFPEFERKQAKIGMLAYLNGGGIKPLLDSGSFDQPTAEAWLAKLKGLFHTDWIVSHNWLQRIGKEALAQGFAENNSGVGIALQRVEAEALRAFALKASTKLGAKILLPMHDGILLSIPVEGALKLSEKLAKLLTHYSTKDNTEATTNWKTWVDVKLSPSWRGDAKTLVGNDLRAKAASLQRDIETSDAKKEYGASEIVPLSSLPHDIQKSLQSIHPTASKAAKSIRLAVASFTSATDFAKHKAHKKSANPPLELPHNDTSYTNLLKIYTEDKAFPKLTYNVRENVVSIDGVLSNETIMRRQFLPLLEQRYDMRLYANDKGPAIVAMDVAIENQFDPVKDYFDRLPPWDGVERLSRWLSCYAGANPCNTLYRTYGTKWLLQIMARAYEPGCKAECVLVFTGKQGGGKSSLLRAIAPADSFIDMEVRTTDKDYVVRAAKYAIVEWGEMAELSRKSVNALKMYFSQQQDELRLPYGAADKKFPRRTIFAASCNNKEILIDETGGRRFWPVEVGKFDLEALKKDKDQLWAEVKDLYAYLQRPIDPSLSEAEVEVLKCKWWLTEAEKAAKEIVDQDHTPEDPWTSLVVDYAEECHPLPLRIDQMITSFETKNIRMESRFKMQRILASTLRKAGFTDSNSFKDANGFLYRGWTKPGFKSSQTERANAQTPSPFDGLLGDTLD
jgi:predicted P-loop ATPase